MNREKYVDESWKDQVASDKERLDGLVKENPSTQRSSQQSTSRPAQEEYSPQSQEESVEELEDESGLNFLNYVSSLAYQAMICLGEVEHPATNAIEKNVEQAKFFIDTLILIRKKTKGNLSRKEEDMLNATLYQLQMKYVEASGQS